MTDLSAEARTFRAEVHACARCEGLNLGFEAPPGGQAFYKFPPTIGAPGRADLLFVGINPSRSSTNQEIHDQLMGDLECFDALAGNRMEGERYIAAFGRVRHYRLHASLVMEVFGAAAAFEDHAAVTELFLCATKDSNRLSPLLSRGESPCADTFLPRTIRQVQPKALVAVGKVVLAYFRERCQVRDEMANVDFGFGRIRIVPVPHPADRLSNQEFNRRFAEAVATIKSLGLG